MSADPVSKILAAIARLEAELNNFKLLVESELETVETRGYQRA
jgi:hypothetical protein